MSDGIEKYAGGDAPVLLLFKDADFRNVRFVRKSDNLRLLSTIVLLRGMERLRMIRSADEIIAAMTSPDDPAKRSRAFPDMPDGYEGEALASSIWAPAIT